MPHHLFIHKLGVFQGKYFDALLMEQVQDSELKKTNPKPTPKSLSNVYGLSKVEILGRKGCISFHLLSRLKSFASLSTGLPV